MINNKKLLKIKIRLTNIVNIILINLLHKQFLL